MKKTIIFTESGGRFSNQLIQHAHLVSFWYKHKKTVTIINISIWPYTHLFKNPYIWWISQTARPPLFFRVLFYMYQSVKYIYSDDSKSTTHFHRFLVVIFHFFGYLWPYALSLFQLKLYFKLNNPWLIAGKQTEHTDLHSLFKSFQRKYYVLSGFKWRHWNLLLQHRSSLFLYLAFKESTQKISSHFISSLRDTYSMLIGVHIRLGDYRKLDWFIPLSDYIYHMNHLNQLYKNDSLAFVVTSDEPVSVSDFCGLNVYMATGTSGGTGHFSESILTLSLCDLIVMPVSTFSGIAAYMQQTPIYLLFQSLPPLSKDDLITPVSFFNNLEQETYTIKQ